MRFSRMSTRFARKLHVAFATVLLITLALAWYFFDTVKWYEHDVRQIAVANEILQGYQMLANETLYLLNGLGQSVSTGDPVAPQEGAAAAEPLRQIMDDIRQHIIAEAALTGPVDSTAKLKRLAEIERVVEQIIEAQESISGALSEGRVPAATDQLGRLHDEGLVALFHQLTQSVLEEQRQAAQRSQGGAIDLARYITGLLPALALVLALLTFVIVWLFSRSLTRSVNALQDGAGAFSSGNLQYRIPELGEVEFKHLGEAFNTMARELAEHRARLNEANVKLESIIEERTRALKESNAKLAAIDDHRRQLLADISHEFRTPLTVIHGEAEIAMRGTGRSAEEYRDSLRRIMDQAMQTTRLVDDLLFIARAEVGEPRLDREETQVAQLLDAVCQDLSPAAARKHIALNRSLGTEDTTLMADSGRLRQVFTILVDNAIKYSNEGGDVAVDCQRADGAVTVTVSDQGIGLSEDELEHVFYRYYRSKKAARHDAGTGLGLPVAKAIVEAHGGEISLAARPQGGTTATVRLPVEESLPGET